MQVLFCGLCGASMYNRRKGCRWNRRYETHLRAAVVGVDERAAASVAVGVRAIAGNLDAGRGSALRRLIRLAAAPRPPPGERWLPAERVDMGPSHSHHTPM